MKRIKLPVLNKDRQKNNDKLHTFQRAVRKQGILAICTILLTVILLFAMTTAWYTNVAQTSGLVFETASWGFSGQIEVGEQAIQAAPGTSGVVPFTITNDSDAVVSIDVTVSKANMSTELQKRIFFYVDTPMERNDEQMQRVYLSSTDGYSYLLRSQEQLTMTEETYNDAPLCWEWVYDMLGYYVQGTMNSNGTMTVERYLRPIVYDYNAATFEEDGEGGKLLTVDGETTVKDFLTEVFKTDGYENADIFPEPVDGYYPVSVTDGSGVWAYLCNFSEIELGINYDTIFAQNSEAVQRFTAILNFTAQNLPSTVVTVDSAASLQDALTDTSVDVVKLDQDITLTDPLSLPAGNSAVLDLNGHSISGSGSTLITANSNSSLSLSNGTIKGSGQDSEQEAMRAIGAVVSLNGMTVQDVGSAVVVVDNTGVCDSRVKIRDCKFTTTQTAVLLQGNGPASAAKSQLIVEESTIDSGYIGISGQGSASGAKQYWGTDVQIINSKVSGKWAGIYQPQQQSTMTISNGCTITGYTGIAVKGGEVTIINSTVTGTGASQEPAAASSGWTDTGDGVYVEATYPWAASVIIKGEETKISSNDRKAVELFEAETGGPGSIKIYGGTFSSDVTEYMVTQEP